MSGSYDRQDISLTAAVGTTAFGPWRFGLRLDYQLGDLSRLRDPRSRSEMLDYRLSPSFTYSIGRSTLGLEGHYRRYKEKIPDITTVQTDPNMKYYTMTGMENANGVVGGSLHPGPHSLRLVSTAAVKASTVSISISRDTTMFIAMP